MVKSWWFRSCAAYTAITGYDLDSRQQMVGRVAVGSVHFAVIRHGDENRWWQHGL